MSHVLDALQQAKVDAAALRDSLQRDVQAHLAAIVANGEAQRELVEAKGTYERAEATALADELADKDGPFKGIATSSKAFGVVLDARKAVLRATKLKALADELDRATVAASRAAIRLEAAKTLFSTGKVAAGLQAAILNAGQE